MNTLSIDSVSGIGPQAAGGRLLVTDVDRRPISHRCLNMPVFSHALVGSSADPVEDRHVRCTLSAVPHRRPVGRVLLMQCLIVQAMAMPADQLGFAFR